MTASDGSYTASLSIASGDVTKPLVVQAECPNTDGGNYVLVTVTPTHASGTVNVNPLTNLISAADGKYAADAILWALNCCRAGLTGAR